MVDDQGLSIIDGIVECLLCHGGMIRLSEADKSKVSILLTRLELDLFNGSELLEKLFELLLSPVRWEIFNVEIASLLRSLVPKGLLHLLGFSVSLL